MNPPRANLPPMPPRIASLPVDDRGYPVPWFVAWIDGKPDFRVIEPLRMHKAIHFHRCWICGEILGARRAFVVGPMCIVNRVSAEPPSHRECARFAAQACPFLTLPKAVRRETNMPEDACEPGGVMLTRNPGVCAIWVTRSHHVAKVSNGVIFRMGEPDEVEWYAMGREASRGEVFRSMQEGLPALAEIANAEGAGHELEAMLTAAMKLMPAD